MSRRWHRHRDRKILRYARGPPPGLAVRGVALIPVINGRPVISRADMPALGVALTTADGWYRNRARNGYPEKAGRIGRTDYWYEDEWAAWVSRRERSRTDTLTRVDRGGDPDELVGASEAARMLGYSGRDVIHANRRLGYFPRPDSYGPARNGRPAPLWKRSTVWSAADGRVGIGGSREPRARRPVLKPHPYAGDQRLEDVLSQLRAGRRPRAADLAAAWRTSRSTAERILRTARTLLETS